MSELCRFCGFEKTTEETFDIKDDSIQETIRKCGVESFMEKNKLLPQSICLECLQILEEFERFLDNVATVQQRLNQNLKDQLDSAPFLCKVKTEDDDEDLDDDSSSRKSKRITPTKKKRPQSSKDKLKSPKFSKSYSKKSPRYSPVKVEVEPFFDDFDDFTNDLRSTKKMPTNPKRKKNSGDIEEDAVERVFEKELKLGKFDHPIESLNVAENEKNADGSLNDIGLQHHGSFKWTDYIWRCSECEVVLSSLAELRRHYRHDHDIRPFYRCSDCPKKFRIISAMFTHYFEHNPNSKFCCMFCDKYYCDVLKLYYHQKKDHKTISKLCLYCGKQFYLCSYLREHREIHPSGEPKPIYTCELCQKNFRHKQVLRSHMTLHLGLKDHICEKCGKEFPKKSYLDTHMIFHQSDRPFKCEICDKGFKTHSNLTRHVVVHKAVKDIVCTVCGKLFNSRPALKSHYRVHTDEMPYECEFCGKRFKHHGVFKDHRRLHTGERPYSCSVANCTASFAGYPNYSKHMKTHGIDITKKNKKKEPEPTQPPPGIESLGF